MNQEHSVIGIMSGTSLDGLDIAFCRFNFRDGKWAFDIEAACCVDYNAEWRQRLSTAHQLASEQLLQLDSDFGLFVANHVRRFINEHKLPEPDLIASHGHTVFHAPHRGYTLQIGSGAQIAATTGVTTVNDFRSLDVALGGQGAPLVPLGDRLLFGNYTACLNLGGFSNISFERDGERLAFDICPVNIAMNPVAQRLGKSYDECGAIAAAGTVLPDLLQKLNALPVYSEGKRPSLSREWMEREVMPLLVEDEQPELLLRTLVEHAAVQMADVIRALPKQGSVLLTGGGTHNAFLIERLQQLTATQLVVPDAELIAYKEALIFAFLGLLRMKGEVNVLRSVTGARQDSCSGAVHLAPQNIPH